MRFLHETVQIILNYKEIVNLPSSISILATSKPLHVKSIQITLAKVELPVCYDLIFLLRRSEFPEFRNLFTSSIRSLATQGRTAIFGYLGRSC